MVVRNFLKTSSRTYGGYIQIHFRFIISTVHKISAISFIITSGHIIT